MNHDYFAAIDKCGTGAVYGVGLTAEEAIADARDSIRSEADDLIAVPMTARAYRYVLDNGGAPSRNLSVFPREVMLRSEEEGR